MANEKVKGLDEFGKKFLIGEEQIPDTIQTAPGQKASEQSIEKYAEFRKQEFIKKAAPFAEDLVAFFVDQRTGRGLNDEEAIFALALANINLREAYGNPQSESEEKHANTAEDRAKRLGYFDGICYGAQQYYDANIKDD